MISIPASTGKGHWSPHFSYVAGRVRGCLSHFQKGEVADHWTGQGTERIVPEIFRQWKACMLIDITQFLPKRMSQLVDYFLTFSRMGKDRWEKPPPIYIIWYRKFWMNLKPEKKLAESRCIGGVSADETLLRQAFQNLISNAVKYSSRLEHPQIEAAADIINGEIIYFASTTRRILTWRIMKDFWGFSTDLWAERVERTGVRLPLCNVLSSSTVKKSRA